MNSDALPSLSLGEDEMHLTYHRFDNNSEMDKNEKEANAAAYLLA